MSTSLLITGEGHGEVEACGRLVTRTLKAQGYIGSVFHHVAPPRRFKIDAAGQLENACEYARIQRPGALLLTSDWEDGCPATDAPVLAARVRQLNLPFPTAVVLFYREYETLALSIADKLAGKTLHIGATNSVKLAAAPEMLADPEKPRDAKKWIENNLLNGLSYKPVTHQLPLTSLMNPEDLRAADLSSFRRLERGLDHLAQCVLKGTADVYPPSSPATGQH